jgi:hypothetical protein
MEEMLYELGPYAAGLNAARWDLKASIFEFVMTDPKSVWPDRFGVDVKTTPFLANIFRRLVAICLKRGAVPIGGMATALPNPDPEVNRVAADAISKDKEWEAEQGFIRAWVAHIFHMKTAAEPFKRLHGSGWKPAGHGRSRQLPGDDRGAGGADQPRGYPAQCAWSSSIEGWLNGRRAGIDSLAGAGASGAEEDLATGRMSVAQTPSASCTTRTTSAPTRCTTSAGERLLHEERGHPAPGTRGAKDERGWRPRGKPRSATAALKIAMQGSRTT